MTLRLSRPWTSIILPAALALLLLAVCLPSFASADFWWHLRTGQLIFETHAVPRADPFSFTAAGRLWIAHEWLSELILYMTYRLGGYPLLLLLVSAVTAIAFGLMAWRSPGAWPMRIVALALALWAERPTFSIRPQAFSLLLFAIFYVLLDSQRQKGSRRALFALPVLTLLWLNLHAAYILGPALILLFLMGAILDSLARVPVARPLSGQVKVLALTAAACLLVVPLNPNGARLYTYPFETLASPAMQTLLMEWRPPDLYARLFYPFFLLLAVSIAAILLQRRRLRPSDLLLFTFFAVAALHSMRYLALFALASIPIVSGIRRAPVSQLSPPLSLWLRAAVLLIAVLLSAWRIRNVFAGLSELERARFPADAATFLQQQHLLGPIFNSYAFGGYLIWRLYPDYRVFIDGRADLYGDAFLKHYVEIYEGQVNPRTEFDHLGVRTVIVEPSAMVGGLLGMGRDWKKVYEDRVAVIYTR